MQLNSAVHILTFYDHGCGKMAFGLLRASDITLFLLLIISLVWFLGEDSFLERENKKESREIPNNKGAETLVANFWEIGVREQDWNYFDFFSI